MKSKKQKVVSLKPFNNDVFFDNKVFELEIGDNIFVGLKEELKKKNIIINTIDAKTTGSVAKYIYCDMPYPWNLKWWLRIFFNKEKNILYTFESPIINPFNHLKILHRFFKRIYTWDDMLVDGKKYKKFVIPKLKIGLSRYSKSPPKKGFLTMVISKKSSIKPFLILSPYKKDLYKERKKAIRYFEENKQHKFSFYGRGWDKPDRHSLKEKLFGFEKYSNYKGEIKENKEIRVISKYKFCFCFENTSAPGYVTEKMFDCLKAQTVPIYYGAPNIEKYVPKDCFIDFRDFLGYRELVNYLEDMTEGEYRKYIEAGRTFLASEKTRKIWFEEAFLKTFVKSIKT